MRHGLDGSMVSENEKLPSIIINSMIAMSSKIRRAIVYAIDEHGGPMTSREIFTAIKHPERSVKKHLNVLGMGGIVDHKIRKNGNDFEDIYELTGFAGNFIKCLVISMSRENVEKCENILKG